MSTHPLHFSTTYMPVPTVKSVAEAYKDRLTLTGALAFFAGLLVFTSGFKSLRPEIGGMLLHPYLIPVALFFPFMVISRLQQFPLKPLAGMIVFTGLYIASAMTAPGGVSEIFKIGCALMVIVGSVLFVQRHSDFVAGAVGLNLAVAILAVRGLDEAGQGGFQGLDTANKNAYSLYALPAILMAGFIILRMPQTKRFWKILLGACAIACLMGIFTSGNRSGYLGAVLIALMLFWDRKIRGLLLVLAISGTVAFLILQFASTEILQERLEQTAEGNASDRYRRNLFIGCVNVGLANPIIGVSPQALPFALARELESHGADPHNVYGHIIGDSGLICFAALVYCGVSLWNWAKPVKNPEADRRYPDLGKLLRMMLFLWLIRGIFSREILYAPGFCLGLGLVIGALVVQQRFRLRPPLKRQAQPAASGELLPVYGS